MRTVVATARCRRVDMGLTRAGGYAAVVNSPRPVACSQQPAHILGIAIPQYGASIGFAIVE
jgi:hypothetical protein